MVCWKDQYFRHLNEPKRSDVDLESARLIKGSSKGVTGWVSAPAPLRAVQKQCRRQYAKSAIVAQAEDDDRFRRVRKADMPRQARCTAPRSSASWAR
jgi:hypothetical protein